MKRIYLLIISALAIASCSSEKTFTVKGEVSNAADKVMYLEASKLEGVIVLDSVSINSKGAYTFKSPAPVSPEFYRLRIGDRTIPFSIDSTEVVEISTNYDTFSKDYKVSGSENVQKIKEILNLQTAFQVKLDKLLKDSYNGKISNKALQENIMTMYAELKDVIKKEYILNAPNTTAAYYALFPKINNYMLFDPLNNKDDLRCFAAVATSFNDKYPHSTRAKNIYNIVIKGMRNTRQAKQETIDIPQEKIQEAGIIDIDLRDITGAPKKLSDLKGKVVLLDFNIFQNPVSSAHIFNLRDLYDKYASKGLEIYQVSLDADVHFWKQAVDNLPWVCVRDEMGIYSRFASAYNIANVPTFFLINRENVLVDRSDNIKDIDKAIKQLL